MSKTTSKLCKRVKSLRQRVRALEADTDSLTAHVDTLERVGLAHVQRLDAAIAQSRASGSQSNAGASAAPERPTFRTAANVRGTVVLSASDVAWLTRTLRAGASLPRNGSVTLTLSAADALTIARRLDAASGGNAFTALASNIR